jgi:SAM-dependent methyltransferase
MNQTPPPPIFSHALRKLRLARAGRNFAAHDFLHRYAAEDALDRLETVQRRFGKALFYGPAAPLLQSMLTPAADVGEVVLAGESGDFLSAQGADDPIEAQANALPFADESFDLAVSLMSLHAESDLPRALTELRRVLRPDGFFIASFPAETTLMNLRRALQEAEAEVTGRVSSRVPPFVALKDAGALLQRAGFALPVADVQPLKVRYRDPLTLFRDLRGMGETHNLIRGAKTALRRDVLQAALPRLAGTETVFELVVLSGWAPDESQPKPLKPGSAKASLADAVRGPKEH